MSFQDFANAKENSLTAQSETLAAEMKQMEEELAEKLKLLEDQLETKEKEEEKLRLELHHRKRDPVLKVSQQTEKVMKKFINENNSESEHNF